MPDTALDPLEDLIAYGRSVLAILSRDTEDQEANR
jgi:hypothetical protein